MSHDQILTIMQDAIWTVLICSLPMLAVGLIVGLLVSIFQATTQINEQTLAFIPKIIAILMAVVIFGSFILTTISEFTLRLFDSVNSFL